MQYYTISFFFLQNFKKDMFSLETSATLIEAFEIREAISNPKARIVMKCRKNISQASIRAQILKYSVLISEKLANVHVIIASLFLTRNDLAPCLSFPFFCKEIKKVRLCTLYYSSGPMLLRFIADDY